MGTERILQEIASGDEAAFRTLFDNYKDDLYYYLVRIIKSREIAEEIVMDIFLQLWVGRQLLPDIKNLDAFLHKVAYHKALDFLKISSRKAKLQKLLFREMQMAKEKEADHKLLDEECRGILDNVIKQLSPQKRLIFILSREEGLTHEEIAKRLNLSRNTVKNTITGTLAFMRKIFKSENISRVIVLLWFLR